MMKRIDNIVIGELVEGVTLEMLGVLDDEVTVHISTAEAIDMNLFLPKMLAHAGVFQNTTEVKRLQKARDNMTNLTEDERFLWRVMSTPELTRFKVGKKLFWVIMGEFPK